MKIDRKNGTYTYKKYMRDGTVQERTGAIRTKKRSKRNG